MAVQLAAVLYILDYLINVLSRTKTEHISRGRATYVISMIMTMLFIGHMIQAAIWALLFDLLGEFDDFSTALYHSLVNFASLGYGDIVMSEDWRLLGAIEASTGVLMFGLSAGMIFSIMNFILTHDSRFKSRWDELTHSVSDND